jgi:hypothetical protein
MVCINGLKTSSEPTSQITKQETVECMMDKTMERNKIVQTRKETVQAGVVFWFFEEWVELINSGLFGLTEKS